MNLAIPATGAAAAALAVTFFTGSAAAATAPSPVCPPSASVSETSTTPATLTAAVTNTCSTRQAVKITLTARHFDGTTATFQEKVTLAAGATDTRTYSADGIASIDATASDSGGSTNVTWTAPVAA